MQLARIGVVGLMWCLITTALGALVIYSSSALERFVSPQIDTLVMLAGVYLLTALFGTFIRSWSVLLVLTGCMCLGGASFFALVVLAPTHSGIIVRTVDLENYATTRVLLSAITMVLPALFGALTGIVVGGWMDKHALKPDSA